MSIVNKKTHGISRKSAMNMVKGIGGFTRFGNAGRNRPFFQVLFALFLFTSVALGAEYFGDRVWNDLNENGIQDTGEPGVAGVTVTVNDVDFTTDANGYWQSNDLSARRNYTVTFSNLPLGYVFSPQDQGSDDNLDSDANPIDGITAQYRATRNETFTHIDAGIYFAAPEIDIQGNGISIYNGDDTPSITDNTYFGSEDKITGSSLHLFTLSNSGNGELTLSGSPYVQISGTHASDFTVTAQPSSSTIAKYGGTGTFAIDFDPNAEGIRTALVTVTNDDADEGTYTFTIRGNGTATPEIDIRGNNNTITDGGTTPSPTNDTDFGDTDLYSGTTTITYTIHNFGSGDLSLTGSPMVQVGGSNAADFTVNQQPASSTVSAQVGTQTFQVTFDPSSTGLRVATLTITNDDGDENPFTFPIQGTGTLNPEIDIHGNGESISDGDATPTLTDSTEYGTENIGNSKIITYTIYNTGLAGLNLTGPWPLISVGGTHSGDFSVFSSPAATIPIGGSTSFKMVFSPLTDGLRSATFTIANNDLSEGNYTFSVQGTGQYVTPPDPEITIRGNAVEITDGDGTPTTTDGTDFGAIAIDGETVNQVFSISNSGVDDLLLSSTPIVLITGTHAADFVTTQQPSSPIATGGSVPFAITFDPSGAGLRTAYVSIENNDQTENPYNFTIQGTGLASPGIQISGNGTVIANGDNSPGFSDSTYLGDVPAGLGASYATYTIHNTGSTPLNLSGSPAVNLVGDNEADFEVVVQPSGSISAGGTSTFKVKFDPSETGLRDVAVSVTSNDPDNSTYSYAIRGNGTGPGSPLACAPAFFQVYGDYGTISYLDATTNPYTYIPIAEAGYALNELAYNLEDGLLYALEVGSEISGNKIVRIDGEGTISVLSSIEAPFYGSNGSFDASGNMYFYDLEGSEIAIFDASEGTFTTSTPSGPAFPPGDMAYLNGDGRFFGAYEDELYVYDPVSNAVSQHAVSGKLADEYNSGVNSQYYGSAWAANDGYIYVSNNESGRMYKINVLDLNNVASVYVGQAIVTPAADAASCPLADAPLPKTATVGDKVWIDSDGDGIQDGDEPGLPGVTVTLYSADSPFVDQTTSDEDGNYLFENLSPGEFYLHFTGEPAGFNVTTKNAGSDSGVDSDIDPTTRETDIFTVGVGSYHDEYDAGYYTTGVGNFVWNDEDQDGVQDAGEPGIPGVNVDLRLYSNNNLVTSTTTDANGFYYFSGVSATDYWVYVNGLPGGFIYSSQNAGSDDALDSDVRTSDGRSDQFTLTNNNFNNSIDAGIYQQTTPEMQVEGLGNEIPDGDIYPSTTDGTEFGSISTTGSTVVRTFTIKNIMGADLSLNGSPVVEITDAHASDFSVSTTPGMTTIASGNQTTFNITFDPSVFGTRTATVSITNNDANENPYTFKVRGIGEATEISVSGNGVLIPDTLGTPSADNSTDFGEEDVASGLRDVSYKIHNSGTENLVLTGSSPYVAITGAQASEFSVITSPSSLILPGDSTSFVIRFNPADTGVRSALLSIANSDADENPYEFNIQGTGSSFPYIEILGNGSLIANGDATPSSSDLTEFSSQDIVTGTVSHTYRIENNGSGNLLLTEVPPIQITGANAGDFIVSQQPALSTIPPSGFTTFEITFDPTTTGYRNANISISNNDDDENPYLFAIRGLGTSTQDKEIEVLGNDLLIDSGDNTPSTLDNTDLGTATISDLPASSTFIIRNIGYSALHLTGAPPYVSIGGTHAAEFNITASPSNSIPIDSATTSFEVSFSPAGLGVRQAIISIANDDGDENPYTFTILGNGQYNNASQSAISVTGNLLSIPNGDITPTSSDGTHFGTVEVFYNSSRANTYVIHNVGVNDDLVLGSTPQVSITGAHASDFEVTIQPISLIAPGSSVSMEITFNPSDTDVRNATVTIGNSDYDENPYTFDIRGEGSIEPNIVVKGNSVTIAHGDNTPSGSDSTDLGEVDINLGSQHVQYTISNNGSTALTSISVSVTGLNSADFIIVGSPLSTLNIGQSSYLDILFDAMAVGTRTATIEISSNDPDTPTFQFDVQGVGAGTGSPIACSPNFYQVSGSGVVSYLDASTSPYTYTTIATAGFEIDGIGYNVEDGFIYGFEHDDLGRNPSEHMVRINAAGEVTELTSIDHSFDSRVADFDDSGNYYFWSDDGTDVRRFDASEGTVTGDLNPSGTFSAKDMAFMKSDGKFYGVHGSTLYVFDPFFNTVTSSVSITGKLNEDILSGTNGNAFPSAWTASDDYLYVANEVSGRMYKINVTTDPGASVFVGQGSVVSNGDGASCPCAPSPLPTTGTIGDLAWLDSDGDGLRDAGEPGLKGITVSLYEADDTFLNSTTTAADGTYSFGGLAASEYYLIFSTPPTGFGLSLQTVGANDAIDSDPDPSTGKTANIDVTPGVVNSSIDAGFMATGVGDYVWLDANEDGLQTGDESGVPGITVELRLSSNNSLVATKTTDANGAYSFTGVTPNTYKVAITGLPAGYTFTSQNQGGDDTIDSDVDANGESASFTIASNSYDHTLDIGVYQSSEPEISIQGNSTVIADGDASPSSADSTDFGQINASASAQTATDSVIVTYTIYNDITGATLTLNGTPRVEFSGVNAADFSLYTLPDATIPAGDNSSFKVKFIPTGEGLRSATLSISNTDADENPYNFNIHGYGLASEITIEGNNQVIEDGDTTPGSTDHTDFGIHDVITGSQTYTFTILNTGNSNLTLSEPVITGDQSDFTLTNAPNTTVALNSITTFTITFDPTTVGLRTAEISVANNDIDEDPYTFNIQGNGTTTPEIDLRGKGISIANGDNTPTPVDDTDFGTKDILDGLQMRTFKIHNTGSGALSLSGNPLVTLSGFHTGDFYVSQQPTVNSVLAGDSIDFKITFDPTVVGIRTAQVNIENSDEGDDLFTFLIRGNGVASSEIDVLGNDQSITNGNITPSYTDSTAMDSTARDFTSYVTYTIKNLGSADLTLTGADPYVSISGTHAVDFSVTQAPLAVISSGGGTTTFKIAFTPSDGGDRVATIIIASDDTDENPYTFAIKGFGLPPVLPELMLVEAVDLTEALPSDTLVYSVAYSNVGAGLATEVIIIQEVPAHSTYVENSAQGADMTIEYSHDNGANYDSEQTAPVTHIRFIKNSNLPFGSDGTVVYKLRVN